MTPRQLERHGRRLFGRNWKSPLARALGLSYQTVLVYAKGAAPIPRAVALAVLYLVDHPPDPAAE